MRGQRSVFCQRHISRTSYHAMADWWQYRINLVTRVPVNFQQKTNIALNYWLDPQIALGFSALGQYAKLCRFCVVYYLCVGNIFKHGNPIVSNKYKNGEINQTIIVIIAIYSTYRLKWCTTITNDFPLPFLIEYWREKIIGNIHKFQ